MAQTVFEQGDLLRLQAVGAEEGLRRAHEVHLFRIFHVVRQRLQAEQHAVAADRNVLFAVVTDGAAQRLLVFFAAGRHLPVAVQALAHRFAGRRAQH